MSGPLKSRLPEIVQRYEANLVEDWIECQKATGMLRSDVMKESELRKQASELLSVLRDALLSGELEGGVEHSSLRTLLEEVSSSRVRHGFSPSETATFVLSLKQPLFERLRQEYGKDHEGLALEIWEATTLLDKLALVTTEAYQKTRDEIIARQQKELMELSTPVVQLWDGVLALPLIGTLDSERTQVVMQNLLQKIVETGSSIAIIDITGVPLVDTLVAQHLLKTIAAARLMGADCIISGIRPQIAQTIVHLGVDLHDVVTKATLSSALAIAFQRTGHVIKQSGHGESPSTGNGTVAAKKLSAPRVAD